MKIFPQSHLRIPSRDSMPHTIVIQTAVFSFLWRRHNSIIICFNNIKKKKKKKNKNPSVSYVDGTFTVADADIPFGGGGGIK